MKKPFLLPFLFLLSLLQANAGLELQEPNSDDVTLATDARVPPFLHRDARSVTEVKLGIEEQQRVISRQPGTSHLPPMDVLGVENVDGGQPSSCCTIPECSTICSNRFCAPCVLVLWLCHVQCIDWGLMTDPSAD